MRTEVAEVENLEDGNEKGGKRRMRTDKNKNYGSKTNNMER